MPVDHRGKLAMMAEQERSKAETPSTFLFFGYLSALPQVGLQFGDRRKRFVPNQKNSFLMLAVGQTRAKVRRMFKATATDLEIEIGQALWPGEGFLA
jgi:hypothetical protein